MIDTPSTIASISEVIRTAVAPVFLLVALSSLLATLIAVLFVVAMLMIIGGLLTFLAETRVASLQAREGMEVRLGEREPPEV